MTDKTEALIPEITDLDLALGNIDHMPDYDDLPDDFKRGSGVHCRAISTWFFNGAKKDGGALVVGDNKFTPKDGVDGQKAIRAIGSIMKSFAPKHEHKIGGCGFLLSEWFDVTEGTPS